MVKPTDAGQRDHVAGLGALGRTPGGCVAVERHARPVVVVEADVVPHEPKEVALAEDDDMIEQLAPHRPDEPLGEAVLPRRARRVGLGREFVAEVDSTFERALEAPSSLPIVYRGLRRTVLKRFPYLVYFRENVEAVQVFGVLHGRRDRRRLRRRSILP